MSTAVAASVLSCRARAETIEALARTHFDIVVIGGGVTGAGAALDATRGLRVALVEMGDYGAGTSSRSGKLIHGGLRYLEQCRFSLVREALHERSLMLGTLCPHLVKPIAFIYPLRHRIWERAYVGAGLAIYDTLGGAAALPRRRHLSRAALRDLAPGITCDDVSGAFLFYDAQVDDARHTLELVRTVVAHGVFAASAVQVIGFSKAAGAVAGVRVRDLESGSVFEIGARAVVNATGVWSDAIHRMAGSSATPPAYAVQASKGVHITVPRDRIDSSVSLLIRAEDSVLFVRTWGRHWLIGTTDTPWDRAHDDPAATSADVDYLLRNVNSALDAALTRSDIDGVFAGLRPLILPLVRPLDRLRKGHAATSKVGREHAVWSPAPGLVTAAGGKYTTYRVMARQVVDLAARHLGRPVPDSTTENVPLLGSVDLDRARAWFRASGARRGLSTRQIEHLLGRYGSLVRDLDALLRVRPDLAQPIAGAEDYLQVEAVYAVRAEAAMHLEDVLSRRTHIAIETTDRGLAGAPVVAALMAVELGWDEATMAEELRRYRAAVQTAVESVDRSVDEPVVESAVESVDGSAVKPQRFRRGSTASCSGQPSSAISDLEPSR